MIATVVIIKVYFLLGDGVNAGLHHRQAFTAFDIVWKLLDTCREETGESLLIKSKLIKFKYEFFSCSTSTEKLPNISKTTVLCYS